MMKKYMIVISLLLLSFTVAAQPPLLETALVDIPSFINAFASPPPMPFTSERSVLTWGDIDGTGIEGNEGTDNDFAYNDAPATEEMYLMILGGIVYGIVRRRKLSEPLIMSEP
jgi:hypothetical protein